MKFVVEKVFERDVDLLILEEFASSSSFAALFLQPAGIALPVQMLEAEHSLTENDLGESDLYFLVKTSSGQRVGIFIEDKINAVAMQRQYDRYVQRAQRMKAAGVFDDYRIFIAAPKKYLDANGEAEKYDHKIAYETLIAYFAAQQDARSSYKHQLLLTAVAQQEKGYTQIKHAAVTAFWQQLAAYLQQHYPLLPPLKGVDSKGAQSLWPEFAVTRGVKVVWKSDKGFVDIEFAGKACEINALHAKIEQWCGHGHQLEQAGASAVLRRKAERVVFAESFAAQQKQIEAVCAAIWEQYYLASEKMDLFYIMNG